MFNKNTYKRDAATNKKTSNLLVAVSLALCFVLGVSFGLQSIFKKQTDQFYTENNIAQILKQNKQRMKETNEQALNNLILDAKTNYKFTKAEEERFDNIINFVFVINNNLDNEQFINIVMQQLLDNLNQVELDLFYNSLSSIGEQNTDSVINKNIVLDVVLKFTLGYLVGNISSFLFGVLAGSMLAAAGLSINPIVSVAFFAAGVVIGSAMENYVNSVVLSQKGAIQTYRFVLLHISIWLFGINSNSELDLMPIFMAILQIAGGKFNYGTPPSGTVPPLLVFA